MTAEFANAIAWDCSVLSNFDSLRQDLRPDPKDGVSGNYFKSLQWFEALAQYCVTPQDSVRLFTASSKQPRMRLALPMQYADIPGLLWQYRTLKSLTNYMSCSYGPIKLCDGSFANSAAAIGGLRPIQDLVRNIIADSRDIDVLQWDSLARDDATLFNGIEAALRAAQWPFRRYFHFGNWYKTVAGLGYDDYLADLSKSQRIRIKRAEKKLTNRGAQQIRIDRSGDDIDRAWDWYRTVYNRSWKRVETMEDFVRHLVQQAASDGSLRIGTLLIAGVPAASQIWLVHDSQATIFKLAYDEAFARLSVGTVLTAAMFRDVMTHDNVSEIDFGRGDDSYKKDWLPQRREFWGIQAYNPHRLRGLIAAGRHIFPDIARRGLSRIGERIYRTPEA